MLRPRFEEDQSLRRGAVPAPEVEWGRQPTRSVAQGVNLTVGDWEPRAPDDLISNRRSTIRGL